MTTLSSGAIVLIGTFLNNVFPTNNDGTLALNLVPKLFLIAAFLFFGLTLAVSAIAMDMNVLGMKVLEEDHLSEKYLDLRIAALPRSKASVVAGIGMGVALGTFTLGIFCFGLAVLISLL